MPDDEGKLPSDPQNRTGAGMFFTSKMVDEFSIMSSDLFYWTAHKEDDWLIEAAGRSLIDGTSISMKTNPRSERTTKQVFDEYATDAEDFSLSRTHVLVVLAKHTQEELISRSQARRVLARFDQFSEVLLNFRGVGLISQGFADEIFRVYSNAHPETRVVWITDVERMIQRVRVPHLAPIAAAEELTP